MNNLPRSHPIFARPEIWLAVVLFTSTLILYGPAVRFDFINLDDYQYVAENPMVAGGLTWAGIRAAFTTVHEQWWLPLLWISYMLDISWFGPAPFGHHLVNILLHSANAALLFWFLCRTTGSRWRGAFVAALFAWHPTRVEAVAWIAARKDVLSGLFFLLGLLAYVQYAKRPAPCRMAAVFILLLAGLMSKAVLVAVPFLLLVLDWWPLGRIRELGGRNAWQAWKPLLKEKWPLWILFALFLAINLRTHVSGSGADSSVTFPTRFGLVAPNVFAYLTKIVWPVRLNVLYPEHDTVFWPLSLMAAAILLGVLAVAFQQRGTRPWLLAGGLWFLLLLAPVVRGIRMGLAQYADRWSYLPLIGLGMAAAWSGTEWAAQGRWARRIALLTGLAALAACGIQTSRQLRWWRNSITLFSRAAHLTPTSALLRSSLGQALVEAGRLAEGEAQLHAALQLDPDKAEYWSNWGVALLRRDDAAGALAAHDEALRRQPDYAPFHNNRANALIALGRKEEAQAALEKALRLSPSHAEAHFNLGRLLFEEGKTEAALEHFKAAVQLRPSNALNWYNAGVALAKLGRLNEAQPYIEKALQLDPNIPEGRATLWRVHSLAP